MISFLDFRKQNKTLDSLHGNCGLDDYSLTVDKEVVENEYEKSRIEELKAITGESKLFSVDKGGSALIELFRTRPEEVTSINGVDKIEFEGGVNVYSAHYGFYINVQRVILPLPEELKVEKKPRIWVIMDEGGEFWKLPTLYYPKAIKDFLGWLKKKKVMKKKYSVIWNQDSKLFEDPEMTRLNYYAATSKGYIVANLKTEDDIVFYNQNLKTVEFQEFVKKAKKHWYFRDKIFKTEDLPLKTLPVTQELVDEYVKEQNNKFKICG